MASIGTVALLVAFALLAGENGRYRVRSDPRRAARRGPRRSSSSSQPLIGAGSKAGLVPLHVWLPLAHPRRRVTSPALMSGVMTKVAVYAFIRIAFDLVGPPDWRWRVPVMVVGAASGLSASSRR